VADEFIPVSGGLRLGFTPKEGAASLPEGYAGDEVAVIVQARLPQVYRDEGRVQPEGISSAAEYSFAGNVAGQFLADENRDARADDCFAAGKSARRVRCGGTASNAAGRPVVHRAKRIAG
jgi:hypothetical protein